jgi:putative glutamine amidotransferase
MSDFKLLHVQRERMICMSNKKPLIIVTASYDYEKNISSIKNLYCEALIEAGAIPILLPLSMREDLIDSYVERCDGLMVTGGPDVDAAYYGKINMPCNGEISPYRDVMELLLIKKALLKSKPILGICRGLQMINVAAGGTLYQDIHEQIKDRQLIKHSQCAPRWYASHQIQIKKDSFIGRAINAESTKVNSFHHQSVKDVAPGFEITAWSEDGIIEAIEHDKGSYVVGAQWHPEDLWKQSDDQFAIFKGFVDICSINI